MDLLVILFSLPISLLHGAPVVRLFWLSQLIKQPPVAHLDVSRYTYVCAYSPSGSFLVVVFHVMLQDQKTKSIDGSSIYYSYRLSYWYLYSVKRLNPISPSMSSSVILLCASFPFHFNSNSIKSRVQKTEFELFLPYSTLTKIRAHGITLTCTISSMHSFPTPLAAMPEHSINGDGHLAEGKVTREALRATSGVSWV
ncbi:hypothetical protein JOM56_013264 [Amanita muscaria]